LSWLLLATFLAALVGLVVYGDWLRERLEMAGVPAGAELLFLAVGLLFFLGVWLLRRFRLGQLKGRANFNQSIRLAQDDGGLRFVTDEVEHYLKWRGIGQILVEHDGVVVSRGNLFFLVPDAAFASAEERLSFIRDVYDHLNASARAISEKHVRAVLKDGVQGSST
jgi:hypothetical protein